MNCELMITLVLLGYGLGYITHNCVFAFLSRQHGYLVVNLAFVLQNLTGKRIYMRAAKRRRVRKTRTVREQYNPIPKVDSVLPACPTTGCSESPKMRNKKKKTSSHSYVARTLSKCCKTMHRYADGTARLACSMAAGVAKSQMMADSFVNHAAAEKLSKAVRAMRFFELRVGRLFTNPRYFVSALVASNVDVSRLDELCPRLIKMHYPVWRTVIEYQDFYRGNVGWNETEEWVTTIKRAVRDSESLWTPRFLREARDAMAAYLSAVDRIDECFELSLVANRPE